MQLFEDLFLGEYNFSVDSKGRVSIPAKSRDKLGTEFWVCRGLDKCICIYPTDKWERYIEKVITLPEISNRKPRRRILSGSFETSMDPQGRIVIPPAYRKYAEIEKDVVVAGVGNHLEIWSYENWENELADIDIVAETLEKAGL